VDLSVIAYTPATRTLQFAGANHSAYLLGPGPDLAELEGLRRSVGPQVIGKAAHYFNHECQWQPGSRLFLFTDGVADQLGGPQQRKLGKALWLEWLRETAHLPLDAQHAALKAKVAEWRGSLPQTDDILLLGLLA
jgi:serine phosphatase RsbU (regulator of sigma subunit)